MPEILPVSATEDALEGHQAEFEYAKAQVELAEAVAQLRAIENLRKFKKT